MYLRSMVTDTQSFIEKAIQKHNNKYDYSKSQYTRSYNKIQINCPVHGIFEQIAIDHLSGYGCIKCGKTWTREKFIERAKVVHGEKYNYSKIVYTKLKEKVCIICPLHGEFWQKGDVHLRGFNCKECQYNKNTYRKSDWIKCAGERKGIFYIIKCWDEFEVFYKLGITYNTVKKRYPNKREMPYKYEIIKEVISSDLSYIWNLEKRFKRIKRDSRYVPMKIFGGHKYECFTIKNK